MCLLAPPPSKTNIPAEWWQTFLAPFLYRTSCPTFPVMTNGVINIRSPYCSKCSRSLEYMAVTIRVRKAIRGSGCLSAALHSGYSPPVFWARVVFGAGRDGSPPGGGNVRHLDMIIYSTASSSVFKGGRSGENTLIETKKQPGSYTGCYSLFMTAHGHTGRACSFGALVCHLLVPSFPS